MRLSTLPPLVAAFLVQASALGQPATGSEAVPAWVIPAGREAFLGEMLGGDAQLPSACRVLSVAVERSTVRARYGCDNGVTEIVLRHPDGATGTLATTDRFALQLASGTPARDLVPAVEARIRAAEDRWEWVRPEAPPDRGDPAGTGASPEAAGASLEPVAPPIPPELTPEEQVEYDAIEVLIRDDELEEALDRLGRMARRRPASLIVGLTVMTLSPRATDPERVRIEQEAADADPTDPLLNFRAGVITHYAGHRYARTRDEKRQAYRKSLVYLGRTLPAYGHVTRVWIYLAVSQYRVGMQAEAEASIERAIGMVANNGDADAWYCRAEVLHRKDVKRALADIETYFEVQQRNIADGGMANRNKLARVREMQSHLEAVARGEAPADAEELFDPLPNPVEWWLTQYLAGFVVLGFVLLGALAGGALWLWRRRRTR